MRCRAILLIAAVLPGCGGMRGAGPESLKGLEFCLFPAAAVGNRQEVFLATPKNVLRYEVGRGRWETVFQEDGDVPTDLATTPSGVLLVLDGDRIVTCLGGYRAPVVTLPAPASRISADEERILYAACPCGDGADRLYRCDLSSQTWQALADIEGGISALCAVRGGCLVASGKGIHKIFEGEGEAVVVHLISLSEGEVLSIASDGDRKVLYFSDGEATFAYLEGQVVLLLPMGGAVRVREDRLTVFDPGAPQLVQLPDAGAKARRILKVGRKR